MATRSVSGPGFHHIAINVSDFDRSLEFYTQGLGLRRTFGWGEGPSRCAMLDLGDGNYVELLGGGKPLDPAVSEAAGNFMHFAIRVPSADDAFARARAAGARERMSPTDVTIDGDRPVKVRIAFCYGPDGEVFEFFENEEL